MDNRHYFATERDREGQKLLIRVIQPNDKAALREAFNKLSPESRYFRFCFTKKQLSDSELAYFTELDGHLHQALVAYRPDGEPLGIGRWVRETESEIAEFALTVADNRKRLGIGTILLRHLAINARREGVHVLQGQVHADNTAMLGLLSHLPWKQTWLRQDQCRVVNLVLPSKALPEPSTVVPAVGLGYGVPATCPVTQGETRGVPIN